MGIRSCALTPRSKSKTWNSGLISIVNKYIQE